MIAPDVASLMAALQAALGVNVACGQITLHMNDGRLEKVETRTFQRLPTRAMLAEIAVAVDTVAVSVNTQRRT